MNATAQMFFRDDEVRFVPPMVSVAISASSAGVGRVTDVTGDWVSVQWPGASRPTAHPRTYLAKAG